MDVVLAIAGVMLVIAASLTLIRIVRGPGPADRVVATDVLITTVAGSLAVAAAINHDRATLAVIVVLSLLAFAGTVSMARFVAGRQRVVGPGPGATAGLDTAEGDRPGERTDLDDAQQADAQPDEPQRDEPQRGDARPDEEEPR